MNNYEMANNKWNIKTPNTTGFTNTETQIYVILDAVTKLNHKYIVPVV